MKLISSCESSRSTPDAAAGPGANAWFIVSQVKANRVVYFTNDPEYRPPQEGDWYFVTHYVGDLPTEMTLRNCWGWRFNGGVFTDVREPSPKEPMELLLESNRRALLKMLNEKIDILRAELMPSSAMGHESRRRKLEEARRLLDAGASGTTTPDEFPFLIGVAAARNLTVLAAAQLIVERDAEATRVMAHTEGIRERLAEEIRNARAQPALVELRRQLLEDLAPDRSNSFAFPASPMEPSELDAPMSEVHRAHEVARLNAQLASFINARRRSAQTAYVGNDILARHKAKLAQALLDNDGAKPEGVDISLLESFARARNLSLPDAARLIWSAMAETEKVLWSSELIKDRLSARIQSIRSLRDIRGVENELRAEQLQPPSLASAKLQDS
jgi:hypothetical protein